MCSCVQDLLFYCPLRNVTRGHQQSLGLRAMPTHVYSFKHFISFDCWGPDYQFCVGWVCHGSKLPFVFNVRQQPQQPQAICGR